MAGSRTFNGTSDVITLSPSASIDTMGGNLTIAAWIFLTDSTTGHAIWGNDGGGTPILRIDAGLVLEGLVMGATSGFTGSTSVPFAVPINAWAHVAMTYDDGGDRRVHLYINGAEVSPYSGTDTVVGAEQFTTGFGAFIGNDIVPELFQGSLAEIRVYNAALSAGQIATIAADTAGTVNAAGAGASLVAYLHLCGITSPEPDASGNGNTGALTGTGGGTASPGYSGCS